ncbi:hypothetical protein BJ508DRAFT_382043 [Ascobolus immersus RN42]|uniref:Uncharacterized protein n=1 Tax=Ascobolus immersus RN42 TaxID=1160509 RepID=A0A3N4H9W3_ASCIM|nr:hypothetical protein BJ508DRAFT_382043 [Ascobolus immersus RN42]
MTQTKSGRNGRLEPLSLSRKLLLLLLLQGMFFAASVSSIPLSNRTIAIRSQQDLTPADVPSLQTHQTPFGYVHFRSEPPGRGTWGIILSSTVTLIFCVSTSLHLNIITISSWQISFFHKAIWLIVSVMEPEAILLVAIGQHREAKKVQTAWRKKFGIGQFAMDLAEEQGLIGSLKRWWAGVWLSEEEAEMDLAMSEAFFAVMGGFVIDATDEVTEYDIDTIDNPNTAPVRFKRADVWLCKRKAELRAAVRHGVMRLKSPIKWVCCCLSFRRRKQPENKPKRLPALVTKELQLRQALERIDRKHTLKDEAHTAPYTATLTPIGFIKYVQGGGINRRTFDRQDIEDKGKADILKKTITAIQALWFVVQVWGRYNSRLSVTLLEVHLLIQVLFALAIYLYWWNKPLDVSVPLHIDVRLPPNPESSVDRESTSENPRTMASLAGIVINVAQAATILETTPRPILFNLGPQRSNASARSRRNRRSNVEPVDVPRREAMNSMSQRSSIIAAKADSTTSDMEVTRTASLSSGRRECDSEVRYSFIEELCDRLERQPARHEPQAEHLIGDYPPEVQVADIAPLLSAIRPSHLLNSTTDRRYESQLTTAAASPRPSGAESKYRYQPEPVCLFKPLHRDDGTPKSVNKLIQMKHRPGDPRKRRFIVKQEPHEMIGICARGFYEILSYVETVAMPEEEATREQREGTSEAKIATGISYEMALEVIFLLILSGAHIAAWNSYFPTQLEKYLWRASSIGLSACPLGLAFITAFTNFHRSLILALWNFTESNNVVFGIFDPKRVVMEAANFVAPDVSPEEHKFYDYTMIRCWPTKGQRSKTVSCFGKQAAIPICLLFIFGYAFCSGFILVECYYSLRTLPDDAFRTPEFADYWPHI